MCGRGPRAGHTGALFAAAANMPRRGAGKPLLICRRVQRRGYDHAMKRALVAVAVGAATALLAAPTAGADDDTFYSQLAELWGLPPGDLLLRADSLAVGYQMCTDMRDGVPREMTARSWHMRFRESSTIELANQMAYIAQSELCPDTAE
ncbi:hypothetical protein PBI_VALIDUS_44 [Mycobacterium phage Validus]|uniref:DUF732 domain-containing protein n=1 Tax=Mycobacterium phage Validus TaxID=1414747 RepID=V5UP37_9CAUD|nr:hypothetical protein CC50_gp067 [Mycobacterium phage Validus]AHB79574.1 hypothetical protein PBI_VALIDUS_44 [Mycobacterium phage Validus]